MSKLSALDVYIELAELQSLTLANLRQIATLAALPGRSKLNRSDLVPALYRHLVSLRPTPEVVEQLPATVRPAVETYLPLGTAVTVRTVPSLPTSVHGVQGIVTETGPAMRIDTAEGESYGPFHPSDLVAAPLNTQPEQQQATQQETHLTPNLPITIDELSGWTLPALRAEATRLAIRGRSKLNRADLSAAIVTARATWYADDVQTFNIQMRQNGTCSFDILPEDKEQTPAAPEGTQPIGKLREGDRVVFAPDDIRTVHEGSYPWFGGLLRVDFTDGTYVTGTGVERFFLATLQEQPQQQQATQQAPTLQTPQSARMRLIGPRAHSTYRKATRKAQRAARRKSRV